MSYPPPLSVTYYLNGPLQSNSVTTNSPLTARNIRYNPIKTLYAINAISMNNYEVPLSFKQKISNYFVCYRHEIVITVIVIIKIDCILKTHCNAENACENGCGNPPLLSIMEFCCLQTQIRRCLRFISLCRRYRWIIRYPEYNFTNSFAQHKSAMSQSVWH